MTHPPAPHSVLATDPILSQSIRALQQQQQQQQVATALLALGRIAVAAQFLHSPTATQTNNVLTARRRFTHSFLIVLAFLIFLWMLVDRYVSSGISGAQRRESEFLRELTSVRDRVLCLPSVFYQSDIVALIEHVCVS